MEKVTVGVLRPERFQEILPEDRWEAFRRGMEEAAALFEGRRVWNINSTAKGGGVAEMLRSLIAYARGMDLDVRWSVMEGAEEFFRVTKRIHNHLHGFEGDGGDLGPDEHAVYDEVTKENASSLEEMLQPQDIVIVHDPQPAGLVEHAQRLADKVIWRCHVGLDLPNDIARNAWRFLTPYVRPADAYVFSRSAFEWEGLDAEKMEVIAPSIDAFSPKNQEMTEQQVGAILRVSGVLPDGPHGEATFLREDGSEAHVRRTGHFLDGGEPPSWSDRLVVQVSRWDRLKDPVGLIEGFARHVAPHVDDVHLVVAGPATEAVADDPEGLGVIEEARAAWAAFPAQVRERMHLLSLPMDDGEENAAIVNALQRRAHIVVQKSLAEGFGLTVAEGMWKGRPVVASRIGGIQDQIEDGVSGVLLDDPTDRQEFGRKIVDLLADPLSSERIGRAARRRITDGFLGSRHLLQYLDLIRRLV